MAKADATAHELAQARFNLIFNALVWAVTGRSRPGIVDQLVYGFLFGPFVAPPVAAVTYGAAAAKAGGCLLYTSPSPRDMRRSRMPSSA